MFTTKNNVEYTIICGPITTFSRMNLILRPAQQFEFDMPGLKHLYFIYVPRLNKLYKITFLVKNLNTKSWFSPFICNLLKKC